MVTAMPLTSNSSLQILYCSPPPPPHTHTMFTVITVSRNVTDFICMFNNVDCYILDVLCFPGDSPDVDGILRQLQL